MINIGLNPQISSFRIGMQTTQTLQANPFASSGGVTAADIQAIQTRIDTLEKNIMLRLDTLQSTQSAFTNTTSTIPAVSGLSQVLPTPSLPPVDLANIFPKAGGSRRFKRSKRSKGSRKK